MFKPLIIIGLSFAFVGCATTSSNSTSTSQLPEKSQLVEKERNGKKIICKRQGSVGTHFKKTQCWTLEEYQARQERDRQKMQDIQANSSTMSPKK